MRFFLFFTIFFCVVAQDFWKGFLEAEQNFVAFKRAFNIKYSSEAEETKRFTCFAQNMNKIAILNSKDQAKYGVNRFTDLCSKEFRSTYLQQRQEENITNFTTISVGNLPIAEVESFDWREKGAVNPVRDQGKCGGGGFAFAAVSILEGAWVVAGKDLTEFSEEEILDCSSTDSCQGGVISKALIWVIMNGITTRSNYPYIAGQVGQTGRCDKAKVSQVSGKFSNIVRVGSSEASYTDYLQRFGPLAALVDASDWQHYTGGIRTTCNGNKVNHGVNIVGFGMEGGVNYWIMRNSWSTTWGEMGYLRLARGVNCDKLTTNVLTIKV